MPEKSTELDAEILAGIYARISDDHEKESLGVARQLKLGRELVHARGGKIVMERHDNDISATYGAPRPGYDDIIEAALTGKINTVVVFHTSRFWRNRSERAADIDRLAAARIRILPVKGTSMDMSTAAGRLMASVIGEFDTAESEFKRERILAKTEELAAAGKIANGGPRPFGFHRVYSGEGPRRKILRDELDPVEAPIVKDLAERALRGESLTALCKWLNAKGIKTSTGRSWTLSALRNTLWSGRIAGLREHHGQVVAEAVWPAIITREQHEQLRILLAAEGRAKAVFRARLHYLSGYVYCSRCLDEGRGGKMRVGRFHGELRYSCPARSVGGCGGRVILKSALEDLVGAYLKARMNDPNLLRKIAEIEGRKGDEVARLHEAIENGERRLKVLEAALDGDEDELPEVVRQLRRERQRVREARTELATLAGMGSLAGEDLPDIAERWDDPSLDLGRRRAVLAFFVDKIVVGPGKAGRPAGGYADTDRVRIVPASRVS